MPLTRIKHPLRILWAPVAAAMLAGCTADAGAANLVLLPFWLIGEGIAAAVDDDSSSTGTPLTVGYCRSATSDLPYEIYDYPDNDHACAPRDRKISKSEFDALKADQARLHCVDGDRLYRAAAHADCEPGDGKLAKADWEALARNHSTPAVL